ncbi:hypothetical protein [Cryptosporangium aurantiacum]|uniref:Ferritin-like domain-containing protein n=1 Tax=Cryptosporangium aurantiacum TaxID=134849 RepID=A0A1M7RLY4_9ACTN|nr:hypothetical protein [Cryptosporangium aurantiacum]SHN47191.1 hypothetical protein SAMN05443668_12139 [Cryptosporangium aurantiacum]
MSFNPLAEKGIPLEQQYRNWRELNVTPLDPEPPDPYTTTRVIALNAIEAESIAFKHNFFRRCPDQDVRRTLAEVRYLENQQQRVVNWLLPGVASVLETTLGYEQNAVDLTAWVARMEPDPYLKQAYEFGVLEDFDHLYRYANLYEMVERRKAEKIVDGLTEVMPGRPTIQQHRHPIDHVNEPYDRNTASPLSKLHALTIMAAEQQVATYYMNVGPQYMEPIARQLYQEIGLIEQQHVTHYESLVDPGETWWEQLLNHELCEVYLYYSFFTEETDRRVKAIWELHLNEEITHLQIAADLLRRHDGREPEELIGDSLPQPVRFESNKAYLRELMADQMDLTKLGSGYVREAHERFEWMQQQIHGGEKPPSERVIDEHRARFGTEYRLETEGPHPIAGLRASADEVNR